MNRKYKVGDWVIFTDKIISDYWKANYGVSIYGKLAKIIYINKAFSLPYLLEFKENINRHTDCTEEKENREFRGDKDQFKLAINHLKFKKWIKG